MQKWNWMVCAMSLWTFLFGTSNAEAKPLQDAPKDALQRLIEGNQRYIHDKLLHPNRSQESREAVASEQKPFATILGCADSRVSPEILFDQGIGDLFVVRVAGNVAGPIEIDSIDYSVLALGSSLILVLGHEKCGAVTAVVQHNTKGIERVANLIEPAVLTSRGEKGDPVDNAVKANIRRQVADLKRSPVIADLIKKGRLGVAGGYYHLTSGEVEVLR